VIGKEIRREVGKPWRAAIHFGEAGHKQIAMEVFAYVQP
jgi:hypothetical protein